MRKGTYSAHITLDDGTFHFYWVNNHFRTNSKEFLVGVAIAKARELDGLTVRPEQVKLQFEWPW